MTLSRLRQNPWLLILSQWLLQSTLLVLARKRGVVVGQTNEIGFIAEVPKGGAFGSILSSNILKGRRQRWSRFISLMDSLSRVSNRGILVRTDAKALWL